MHISPEQFTQERLREAFATPFFKIVCTVFIFLLTGLGIQGYWYFTSDLSGPAISASSDVVALDMRVVAGVWRFEPALITVPQGATVQLSITNEDPQVHGFAIAELGIDERLPGNQTTEVTFVASVPPGEYGFFCSVMCGAGHFGQKGILVVTEATAASVATDSTVIVQPVNADYAHLPVRSRKDAIKEMPFVVTEDGVKEFYVTVEEVMWDYGDGNPVYSWGYMGQLPGPDIRVTEGDRVRFVVENKLPEPTSIHWHGVDLRWEADGVPGVTMDPIQPGDTYVYEFTMYPAGTRFYHTHGSHHGDEAKQMDMGLAGALIIEPKDFDRPDNDITMVLTERIQNGLYAIQGAVFPAVPDITVREGELTRIRFINAGSSTIHPMHLHGHQFRVVAVDGNPIPEVAQLTRNVQPVLPGETYDIEFVANNPGAWLLHCHELQHAAGGMIGTVTYEGFTRHKMFSEGHESGH